MNKFYLTFFSCKKCQFIFLIIFYQYIVLQGITAIIVRYFSVNQMSRKVLIQYIEYRRAIPPSPHFGNNCNYQDCSCCEKFIQNMENRHINRMYVERDHSLRMRCHERIDHAAVYQKCIKTNAEAYRLIARNRIEGSVCIEGNVNANRALRDYKMCEFRIACVRICYNSRFSTFLVFSPISTEAPAHVSED